MGTPTGSGALVIDDAVGEVDQDRWPAWPRDRSRDLLLKGGGDAADNIVGGPEHSTLANDAFPSREFDGRSRSPRALPNIRRSRSRWPRPRSTPPSKKPLDESLSLERQMLLWQTEDHDEGIAAFMEKRKPKYQGR